MCDKRVIFHLSDKYLTSLARRDLKKRKYNESYVTGNRFNIFAELYKIEYCEYLDYVDRVTVGIYHNNLMNIYNYFYNVVIIYDLDTNYDNPEFIIDRYDLDNTYNGIYDIYEIYFLDLDNILMYNHNVYYQDLLESHERYAELSILLRFIVTIGIPVYNNTKSARAF